MRKKYQPKYSQGEVLTFPQVLVHLEEGRYVYWHDKPQHPSWLMSMRLNTLLWAARSGFFREAIVNGQGPQQPTNLG